MTVSEQVDFAQEFFDDAVNIMFAKATTYSPDALALISVFYAAADANTMPHSILWTMVHKHLTAVRGYATLGVIPEEGIRSRAADVSNYMALLILLDERYAELIASVRKHNTECLTLDDATRQQMAAWLDKFGGTR